MLNFMNSDYSQQIPKIITSVTPLACLYGAYEFVTSIFKLTQPDLPSTFMPSVEQVVPQMLHEGDGLIDKEQILFDEHETKQVLRDPIFDTITSIELPKMDMPHLINPNMYCQSEDLEVLNNHQELTGEMVIPMKPFNEIVVNPVLNISKHDLDEIIDQHDCYPMNNNVVNLRVEQPIERLPVIPEAKEDLPNPLDLDERIDMNDNSDTDVIPVDIPNVGGWGETLTDEKPNQAIPEREIILEENFEKELDNLMAKPKFQWSQHALTIQAKLNQRKVEPVIANGHTYKIVVPKRKEVANNRIKPVKTAKRYQINKVSQPSRLDNPFTKLKQKKPKNSRKFREHIQIEYPKPLTNSNKIRRKRLRNLKRRNSAPEKRCLNQTVQPRPYARDEMGQYEPLKKIYDSPKPWRKPNQGRLNKLKTIGRNLDRRYKDFLSSTEFSETFKDGMPTEGNSGRFQGTLRPNVTSTNPDDFYLKEYTFHDHPYLHNVLMYYSFCMNYPTLFKKIRENTLVVLKQNDTTYTSGKICLHAPTIRDCATDLSAALLNAYSHFQCKTDRRLSKSEKSYWFGIQVLPIVLNQLICYDYYQLNNDNVHYTAMEVVYSFLRGRNLPLPHIHLLELMTENDVNDVTYLIKSSVSFNFKMFKQPRQLSLNYDSWIKMFVNHDGKSYLFPYPVVDLCIQSIL